MSDETIGGEAPGAIFWHALRAAADCETRDGKMFSADLLATLPPFDDLSPGAKSALYRAAMTLLARATEKSGERRRVRMGVTVNGALVAAPILEQGWDLAHAKTIFEVELVLMDDPAKEPEPQRNLVWMDRKDLVVKDPGK